MKILKYIFFVIVGLLIIFFAIGFIKPSVNYGHEITVNKSLKELSLPKEALISAIKRNDEVIIPDGNSRILADDMVTIIGKKGDVKKAKNKLN